MLPGEGGDEAKDILLLDVYCFLTSLFCAALCRAAFCLARAVTR